MSIRLLDVNVIISLLDSAHVHHGVAVEWFDRTAAQEGWSTCPITENGFIRIVSHINYPNMQVTPGLAAQSLTTFQAAFQGSFHFWNDDVSLADSTLFNLHSLTTSGQTTDAYLAGLAFRKGGRLATLDRGIQWRAVRGADAALVERIVA
jgi:toxin-antitoxin system PIN domain toxin